MIIPLRIFFVLMLGVMLWGTARASLEQALFDVPAEVYLNPWFQVTLLDAYFAFLTTYLWIAWKEPSVAARVLWLIAVLLWGSFALATYALIELWRVPASASLREVLVSRRGGRAGLPATLVALGAVAYLAGALNLFS